MSLYLSWGIFSYIFWVALCLTKLYFAFKLINLKLGEHKSAKRWAKVLAVVPIVYLLQFPWQYSTQYIRDSVDFDRNVQYDVEMVERDKAEESWEARSKRQLEEARKAADERTKEALDDFGK